MLLGFLGANGAELSNTLHWPPGQCGQHIHAVKWLHRARPNVFGCPVRYPSVTTCFPSTSAVPAVLTMAR
ncbi:MAG: hypothetical protein RL219_2302 [Actinomycetota bacterium]